MPTPGMYTLSLHDALPISEALSRQDRRAEEAARGRRGRRGQAAGSFLDRKSTRLNSSHTVTSYAVFCLKKKNTSTQNKAAPAASRYSTARLRATRCTAQTE